MARKELVGITRCLAISGCTDFSWVDEESKWKGSEIHRIVEFANKGTLERKSVPANLKGYLAARDKFTRETGFIAQHIEKQVQNKALGIRGRLDAAGLMHGNPAIVDYKSGAISPAVGLQLCLGAFLLEFELKRSQVWWERYAVKLNSDGSYSMKCFKLSTWHADLSTALAAARVAQWKIRNGLA